jgi:hypothetical protein
VNTGSRAVRDAYAKTARERLAGVHAAFEKARVPVLEVRTDRSYLPVLMRYFAARRRGRRVA